MHQRLARIPMSCIAILPVLLIVVGCSFDKNADDARPSTALSGDTRGSNDGEALATTVIGGDTVVECPDGDGGRPARLAWSRGGLSGRLELFAGIVVEFAGAPIRDRSEEGTTLVVGAKFRATPGSSDRTQFWFSPDGWMRMEGNVWRGCPIEPMRRMISALKEATVTQPAPNSCAAQADFRSCRECCRPRPDFKFVGERSNACQCAAGCATVCGASCTDFYAPYPQGCFDCLYGEGSSFAACHWPEKAKCDGDPDCAAAEQCLADSECQWK